jgi:hypothetical protein
MVPHARSNPAQPPRHEPLFDVHPSTGARPTARWRRLAKAALVGSGGLAGAGLRQTGHLLVRLQRATQPIVTQ